MPPISYILQGRLGLSNDVICFDIMQACTEHVVGLIQSFLLIDTFNVKKNTISFRRYFKQESWQKRPLNSRPIIGGLVNLTIIEPAKTENRIITGMKNFGNHAEFIKIPAGGLKCLS